MFKVSWFRPWFHAITSMCRPFFLFPVEVSHLFSGKAVKFPSEDPDLSVQWIFQASLEYAAKACDMASVGGLENTSLFINKQNNNLAYTYMDVKFCARNRISQTEVSLTNSFPMLSKLLHIKGFKNTDILTKLLAYT